MQAYKPETHYIQMGDARRVAYCEYGDSQGQPVFYFHGTPGSRYEPAFAHEAGKTYGYRLIALDRPGIGQSSYKKGRSLLDWRQDVQEIAHQLGIGRFGVIGLSGGGPYALACSYALPEQLEFAVLMGSWGPVAAEPRLWAAMAPLDRFFGKLSGGLPWMFYVPFSLLGFAARKMSPQGFVKATESSMSAADKQLMADTELAGFYAADIAEAFQRGVRGPADDAIILYGEWGFEVAEIGMEVQLFHGEEDRFAPYSFAEYLAEQIPRARLHRYPGQGHLFLVKMFGEVFASVSQ